MRAVLSEFADLTRALAEIQSGGNIAADWMALSAYAARLGATLVMVTTGAQVHPFTNETTMFTGLSADAIRRLDAAPNGKLPKRLEFHSPEPFISAKHGSSLRTTKVVTWYARLRRLLAKDALFVVPVQRDETIVGVMTFSGKIDSFDPLARSALVLLAHAAFARATVLTASRSPIGATSRLSARERVCLRSIANGETVTEAGRRLGISPRTVRFHLDNARTKLGVHTRAQAVHKALRQKLLAT